MKWIKRGLLFNPADVPSRPEWMNEYAQAPATLMFDDFVRVYFSCRPPRDADGQFVSHSAFVDLDRRNLFNIVNLASQPVLPLGELGTFDEFGTYPMSVIRRSDEIWAYYAGWTRCESVPFNVAIGLGISTDQGVTFRKLGPGPLLEYSPDEPFTMSGPKVRFFNGRYYLFYIAGDSWVLKDGKPEISHKIRMAISEDGLNWKKHHKNLIPDRWGMNESQASPDVFFANGRYHMFFCGWVPRDFRQTRSRKIGYAWSTDGINWHKEGKAIIPQMHAEECQALPTVIRTCERYHMIFCHRHTFGFRTDPARAYRLGYAWSDDLVHWHRDDTSCGLETSIDSWDSDMVCYPHLFSCDGKIYLTYNGNHFGRDGFGLAELERE